MSTVAWRASIEAGLSLVAAGVRRRALMVVPARDVIASPHPTWPLRRARLARVVSWNAQDAGDPSAQGTVVALTDQLDERGVGVFVDEREEVGVARLQGETIALRALTHDVGGRERTFDTTPCGANAVGDLALVLDGTVRGGGPTADARFIVRLGFAGDRTCLRRLDGVIEDVGHRAWLRADADVGGLVGVARRAGSFTSARCRVVAPPRESP